MVSIVLQSAGPFLFYILLQIPVFFVGMVLSTAVERENWNRKTALKTYVSGQLVLWAILQIMAVPLILLRAHFNVLFFCFIIISAVLGVFGGWRYIHLEKKGFISAKKWFARLSPFARIVFIVFVCMVLLQVLSYYLGEHIDFDDARWLAESNDALTYGDMMTRNCSTGEYMGHFGVPKDITSPWALFFAILARILHVNVAVGAHTVYAPVALLISYIVYYLIAYELFDNTEARLIFLMMVSLINLFFAGTVFTQSVFSLIRIWQGKATVAAVIIPFLLYLAICINKRDERTDWIRLGVTCCAACLLSGMGISISGILAGVFGMYSIVAYHKWKRIGLWLIALSPAVVFSILYFYWKG